MTPEDLLRMDPEGAMDVIDQLVDVDPIALRDVAFALLRDLRSAREGNTP